MTKFFISLGAILSASLMVSTLNAQNLLDMEPGSKVAGFATLGSKQIPLPDGEWELVILEKKKQVANAFLAQKSDGNTLGYLHARTNLEIGKSGWKPLGFCKRKDAYHNASERKNSKKDADCWVIYHFVLKEWVPEGTYWKKLHSYIEKTSGTSTIISSGYYMNDIEHYLWVDIGFNPTAYGFPALNEREAKKSVWHQNAIDTTPRHREFIEAVKVFGAKYRDAVRAGFNNKLGGGDAGLKFVYVE